MTVVNTASRMLGGVQPRVLTTGAGVIVLSTISMTTALALNDVFNMLQIEADASEIIGSGPGSGPLIADMAVDSAPLDTGTTILLDFGDSGLATRFYSSSTVAQTAGTGGNIQGPNVAGTIGYQPFAATFNTYTTVSLQTYTIQGKVHTAAGTAAAGNLTMSVTYTYDP